MAHQKIRMPIQCYTIFCKNILICLALFCQKLQYANEILGSPAVSSKDSDDFPNSSSPSIEPFAPWPNSSPSAATPPLDSPFRRRCIRLWDCKPITLRQEKVHPGSSHLTSPGDGCGKGCDEEERIRMTASSIRNNSSSVR